MHELLAIEVLHETGYPGQRAAGKGPQGRTVFSRRFFRVGNHRPV
jgi:hypothetical protein